MPVEDICNIPFLSAIQFNECAGNDDDYVFIVKSSEILDPIVLDNWDQLFSSVRDYQDDSRFIIICNNNYELIRIKKKLLPFL